MFRSPSLFLAGLFALLIINPARAVDLFTFRDAGGHLLAFTVPDASVIYQSGCKCGNEDATRLESFEPLGRREKGSRSVCRPCKTQASFRRSPAALTPWQ
jgi:hypothetical protein